MAKGPHERLLIFITFVTCCVSAALLSVSLGTKSWISADCTNEKTINSSAGTGTSSFGLFAGDATFYILSPGEKNYKIVCLEHQCMYSNKETKGEREDSLQCILHPPCNSLKNTEEKTGKSFNTVKNIEKKAGKASDRIDIPAKNHFSTPKRNLVNDDAAVIKINNYLSKNIFRFLPPSIYEVDGDTVPELMSQELWIATIALLCGALLFAVVGSIFAVINTATTPIEFITGVPGLYIWNGLAAAFALSCVICWGVQYSLHLTSNVLIEDSADGWTTEGMEHLGYSYWLVVGAVVIHLANCVLIGIGTYERKVKTQYEAPETKPGNIMLY